MRTPRVQTGRYCRCGRPVVALKAMVVCESGAHPAFCTASAVGLVNLDGLERLLADVRGDS